MIEKTDEGFSTDAPSPNRPSPTKPASHAAKSTPTASSSSASSSNNTGESPLAVIGPKIRIKGDLSGDEDILIQGTVEGTIDLKQHELTIGVDGQLKANANARTITIEGKVEGDLFGSENIVILKSSHVRGNLISPRVSLEDGAKFRGSIDMEVDSKAQSAAPSSPNAPDSKPSTGSPTKPSNADSKPK